MENKETIVMMGVALVIGILLGVGGTMWLQKGAAPSRQAPPQGSAPAPPAVNFQEDIRILEGVVAKDPNNRNAWVQLGHKYFDSQQPMKAVDAYDKALAMDSNDPNVLTDQGVMFRQLGWYDKAIENFKKANELNPKHIQSLFNLGIVYRYDLQDLPNAIESWEKYLKLNPGGQGAAQVQRELEALKGTGSMQLPEGHPPLPDQSK